MTPEQLEQLRKNAQWAVRAQRIETALEGWWKYKPYFLSRDDWEWQVRRHVAHQMETDRATR